MIELFTGSISGYRDFLSKCSTFIHNNPNRLTLNVLDDLRGMKVFARRRKRPLIHNRHTIRRFLERLKFRIIRDLFGVDPCKYDKQVQCSSYVMGKAEKPAEPAALLNSWIGPLMRHFKNAHTLSLKPFVVSSASVANSRALLNFGERLKTFEELKELEIVFRTISELLTALEIGLDRLSFSLHCKLTIVVKSISPGDHEILAKVLARNAKIYKLTLPHCLLMSLVSSPYAVIEALKIVDYPKVPILF